MQINMSHTMDVKRFFSKNEILATKGLISAYDCF